MCHRTFACKNFNASPDSVRCCSRAVETSLDSDCVSGDGCHQHLFEVDYNLKTCAQGLHSGREILERCSIGDRNGFHHSRQTGTDRGRKRCRTPLPDNLIVAATECLGRIAGTE